MEALQRGTAVTAFLISSLISDAIEDGVCLPLLKLNAHQVYKPLISLKREIYGFKNLLIAVLLECFYFSIIYNYFHRQEKHLGNSFPCLIVFWLNDVQQRL